MTFPDEADMDDDRLIDYALNQLDPADRAAADAHLAGHPADAARLARLRRALRPLEADRNPPAPPTGLAVAAIARAAEYAVAHRLLTPPRPDPRPLTVPASRRHHPPGHDPVFAGWGVRRVELAVAAGIGFLAVGLAFAGLGKVRQQNQVLACQNHLRDLHAALSGYAETHGGRYPEAGTAAVPTAGAFVAELNRTGHYPAAAAGCPAGIADAVPEPTGEVVPAVGYAYTLGYRGAGGGVVGVRAANAPGGVTELVPVTADLPGWRGAGAHGRGQNVLYTGGLVRFSTTTAAGVNGDDIYRNDAGLVRAGLHRDDASLGRRGDVP